MDTVTPELGMKRAGNGDNDDADIQKKPRTQDAEKLRLLVLGRYAGILIGKGGENFKRLRETYGVKITGLSSRANERVIQLDGPRADCLSIVKELMPLCPVGRYSPSSSGKSTFEVNVLANTDLVGSLIGKGGSKIREITEQTGTKLRVYQECLPNSNERVIALGGEEEDVVVQGLDTIFKILDNAPKRSPTVYFHPDKTAELLGKGAGNNTPGMPMPPGGHTPGMPGGHPSQEPHPPQTEAIDTSNIAVLLVAQRNQKHQKGFDASLDFGSVQTVTTLTLSNKMCGPIIGKGGENIRYIKQVSGANISTKKCEDSDDRILTMTGTQDQIQVAEQLMEQCVSADKRHSHNQQQQQQHYQQEPHHQQQPQQPPPPQHQQPFYENYSNAQQPYAQSYQQ